ncbi:hypothetical protein HYH03_016927 [Edaphochlamys debaryana]|uniref:Protein kinase domain-containing protein n=1 Tax=Edaphochlamys debaryana TaxID=47281 RepID=A0A835XK41_9CHLO|nr:hypothetical protein HYH03_016927 [Edaphochlamys debaryana]|eukprot:KAG2484283.1 hypothetical protein HYH03_016927 [Edaphochlamys debaryana]
MAELGRVLGVGGIGAVYRAGDQLAIKITRSAQSRNVDQAREAEMLQAVGDCSAVVNYHGELTWSPGQTGLLLELCQESLTEVLCKRQGQRLAGLEAQRCAVMLINALAQVQARGVVHQDIKPGNFLLAGDGSFKLCDFNLSRFEGQPRGGGGTPLYFSPALLRRTAVPTCSRGSDSDTADEEVEVEDDEGYAADWWALGVTLFQVLYGAQTWPFSRLNVGHLAAASELQERLGDVAAAVQQRRLFFRRVPGVPAAAKALIQGLLHPEPSRRFGLLEVLAGDWPEEAAFSGVAAAHPALAADMGRLMALRKLCRMTPGELRSLGEGGALGAPVPSPLQRMSGRLLQRLWSGRSAAATPGVADADDLSSPHDQAAAAAIAALALPKSPALGSGGSPGGSWRLQGVGLILRSAGGVRAAAARAAAAAPLTLLTPDRRLALAGGGRSGLGPGLLPPAFVDRTAEVDVAQLRAAVEGAAPPPSCPQRSLGQVQGVEVLDEMQRLMRARLQRKEQQRAQGASTMSLEALPPAGPCTPFAAAQLPAHRHCSPHGALPARGPCAAVPALPGPAEVRAAAQCRAKETPAFERGSKCAVHYGMYDTRGTSYCGMPVPPPPSSGSRAYDWLAATAELMGGSLAIIRISANGPSAVPSPAGPPAPVLLVPPQGGPCEQVPLCQEGGGGWQPISPQPWDHSAARCSPVAPPVPPPAAQPRCAQPPEQPPPLASRRQRAQVHRQYRQGPLPLLMPAASGDGASDSPGRKGSSDGGLTSLFSLDLGALEGPATGHVEASQPSQGASSEASVATVAVVEAGAALAAALEAAGREQGAGGCAQGPAAEEEDLGERPTWGSAVAGASCGGGRPAQCSQRADCAAMSHATSSGIGAEEGAAVTGGGHRQGPSVWLRKLLCAGAPAPRWG